MRIAILVNKFPSISETFIINQVNGIILRGHLVKVFALIKGDDGLLSSDLEGEALLHSMKHSSTMPRNKLKRILKGVILYFKYFNYNVKGFIGCLNIFKNGKYVLNIIYRAIPFLESETPDIVHCQFGTLGLLGVRLRELGFFRCKVITTFRGFDLSRTINIRGDKVYTELFQKCDLFLTVSNQFKENLIKLGCDEKKIIVHRSGIDCNKFEFISRRLSNDNLIKLLSVGRLVEKKGFKYSIKAVAQVIKNTNYKILYKIIGDGPLMNYLTELIYNLGLEENIILEGFQKHEYVIKEIYNSHILLAPSVTSQNGDQEGIPNVLKEAMATGMPVISTYHSGIPELIKHGISGFLVDEKDITGLSYKLNYLICNQDIWLEMGKEGRKVVENNYDINKLNDELINIYSNLISSN